MYKQKISDPLHPLNNIKITNYFNDQTKFNGLFFKKQFT